MRLKHLIQLKFRLPGFSAKQGDLLRRSYLAIQVSDNSVPWGDHLANEQHITCFDNSCCKVLLVSPVKLANYLTFVYSTRVEYRRKMNL